MSQPPPLPPPLPEPALEPHVRQLVAIAELLLAAANSDGTVSWSERSAIASVLAGFVGESDLPEVVHKRMAAFEFGKFKLEEACSHLQLHGPEDRASLLGLIARVTDADAVLKIGERSFLQRVAKAIGAGDDELVPFVAADPEKPHAKPSKPPESQQTLPQRKAAKKKKRG